MHPPGPPQTLTVSRSAPPDLLRVDALRKSFGTKNVLSGVSFQVDRGGILSILGRSGTGKSVLLRCLVGLLPYDSGEVRYLGKPLAHRAHMHRLRTASSYVFQHNALFDSVTVFENVQMPLRARGLGSAAEWDAKTRAILERMELLDAARRYPEELSGGMQKRLAVARALVTDPELVFFDEPTAGLDPLRRNAVFEMIARLQSERNFTAVLVTHDVQEALVVSSQVLWLEEGAVRFWGTPSQFSASRDELLCKFRDNLQALRTSLA